MIRMTRQADYGTVLLTFFAQEDDGRMLSARDLAKRAKLPLPTVTKILKMLARAGVLISHRGVKGGYGLARRADQITIAEIITALEGPIAMTHCSANADGCNKQSGCPARPSWQRIDIAVRDVLAEITLSELAGSAACRLQRSARAAGGATASDPGHA